MKAATRAKRWERVKLLLAAVRMTALAAVGFVTAAHGADAPQTAKPPAVVTLKQLVAFPVVKDGKEVGEIEVEAGAEVKLLEVIGTQARVQYGELTAVIPLAATDYAERLAAPSSLPAQPAKPPPSAVVPPRPQPRPPPAPATLTVQDFYKGPLSDAEVEASAQRAVKFLLDTQDTDGGWTGPEAKSARSRIALTAVACQGLVAWHHLDPRRAPQAVRRGLEYMLPRTADKSKLQPNLRASSADWAIFGVPFALRGLLELRQYADAGTRAQIDTSIRRLIEVLYESQRSDYTWSYLPGPSQTFTTANVLHALARAKLAGFPILEQRTVAAAQRLKSKKVNDAWPYSFASTGAQVRGAQGRSAQCELALLLLKTDGHNLETLQRVVENFFTYYADLIKVLGVHGHLPPFQNAGYYVYWGHYFEAEAISLLPEAAQKKYFPMLAALIVRTQRDDGSFFDAPCGGKPYGTGMALMTLALSQPPKTDSKFKLPARIESPSKVDKDTDKDNTDKDPDKPVNP